MAYQNVGQRKPSQDGCNSKLPEEVVLAGGDVTKDHKVDHHISNHQYQSTKQTTIIDRLYVLLVRPDHG